ncbi:MAG: hypothetical protein GQ531_00805 [Sulfurovum sp.]|nr:hypothetical protein [Sulfurovum sp.]
MEISVDISMYPLQKEYEAPISAFIERLKTEASVTVSCNELSTQLHGDYRTIMKLLEEEIYSVFNEIPDSIFVLKFVGHNREGKF